VDAEFHVLESPTGHMAVVLDIAHTMPILEKFLNS